MRLRMSQIMVGNNHYEIFYLIISDKFIQFNNHNLSVKKKTMAGYSSYTYRLWLSYGKRFLWLFCMSK